MTLWPRSCLHSKSRFHNRSDPRKSREEPCWKCRRVTVVTVTSCWRHLSCWQTQGPTKIYQSCKLMNVDKSGNTNNCYVIHRNTLKSERSLCWQGSWIESNCSGCHPLFQQPFVDLQLAHPGCYGFQQQPAAARKNKTTGAAIVSPLGLKIETPMGWHEELNLDAKTASCLKSPWRLHPPKKWHDILKKMPFERGSSLAKIFFQGYLKLGMQLSIKTGIWITRCGLWMDIHVPNKQRDWSYWVLKSDVLIFLVFGFREGAIF